MNQRTESTTTARRNLAVDALLDGWCRRLRRRWVGHHGYRHRYRMANREIDEPGNFRGILLSDKPKQDLVFVAEDGFSPPQGINFDALVVLDANTVGIVGDCGFNPIWCHHFVANSCDTIKCVRLLREMLKVQFCAAGRVSPMPGGSRHARCEEVGPALNVNQYWNVLKVVLSQVIRFINYIVNYSNI